MTEKVKEDEWVSKQKTQEVEGVEEMDMEVMEKMKQEEEMEDRKEDSPKSIFLINIPNAKSKVSDF